MNLVAIKMLVGDRAKYLGIVMGLMFASFLITQQLGIFIGVLARMYSVITDVTTPDIWVMDPAVKNVDDNRPMPAPDLYRVKSIPGVAWAVPMFKGQIKARLANGLGYNCTILGLDDETMVGGPPKLFPLADGTHITMSMLRQPDAIIMDDANAREKFGGLKPGDTLELNDHRAKIIGLGEITPGFQTLPVIYTTYSRAISWVPAERNHLSFILVHAAPNTDHKQICRDITARTGLAAYTREEWKTKTLWYYIKNTAIPVNFGTTVMLGFVVGIAIAGLLFYQFTMDNIRNFGTLKAMGAPNGMLTRMILLQTFLAGIQGYALGIGATGAFTIFLGIVTPKSQQILLIVWQNLAATGIAVMLIIMASALFAMIKVIRLEPAIVFK